MPKTSIPERLPVTDVFDGSVVSAGERTALSSSAPVDGTSTLFSGSMIIRYGIRYLGKPHLSIVPGLVVVDYGMMLNSEEAWEFLMKKSNLYPRAEVFGFRNDGRDEMLVVKALDLALPPEVLVFTDSAASVPFARPTALLRSDMETESVPERLKSALPNFTNAAEWLASTA